MYQNKVFAYSIIISCLLHGMALFYPPNFRWFSQNNSRFKDINVNYYILKQDVKEEPKLTVVKKMAENKPKPVPQPAEEPAKTTIRIKEVERNEEPIEDKAVNISAKDITLPDLPQNFPNRPQYLNYYQIVRERIKFFAYKNFVGDSTGEVFLKFALDNRGGITDVAVVDEQSQASNFLKRIAFKSVRDASPYPAFPPEITFPSLKFNIIIVFELKK